MLARLRTAAVLTVLACVCIGATYAGAALALERPRILRLDTSTASRLTADYSSDPRDGPLVPPLTSGLIASAAEDVQPIVPTASPTPPRAGTTAASGAGETPRAGTPTADASSTAAQQSTKTPAAATDTPEPGATDTPGPLPTNTPERKPTETPVPTATYTSTPRPAATCIPGKGIGVCGAKPTPTPEARPTNTPTPTATPLKGCFPPIVPLLCLQ